MIVNVYKYDGTVYEVDAPEVIAPETPTPEQTEDDVWAELDKAYTEGVNSAYDQ